MLKAVFTFIVLIFLGSLNSDAYGQYSGRSMFWKSYRMELIGGIGGTSFLGELGGRDEIGADFIYDFEFGETRPNLNLGIRYYVAKQFSVRGDVSIGQLAGNDDTTKELFRMKRNLHFRALFAEVSALAEFTYQKRYVNNAKTYKFKTSKNRYNKRIVYSMFAGVGFMYFEPRAKYNGDWYKLQPLGTEGQNLDGGPAKYKKTTLVFPIGLSLRKPVSKRVAISIELNHRFTLTDYLDDVSGLYVDTDLILEQSGEAAAYFSDPSIPYGLIDGDVVYFDNTKPGMQRGDPSDNDSFFTVNFGVAYSMKTKKYRRRKARRRGSRRGNF